MIRLRRTSWPLALIVLTACGTHDGESPTSTSRSSSRSVEASLALESPGADAFCDFLEVAGGDVLADPAIPPAFLAVIAGGDPDEAVAIANDRLLPAIQEVQRLINEMEDEPRAATFVTELGGLVDDFEAAVAAFAEDPSKETAGAVDEAGGAFDAVAHSASRMEAVARDLFGTEC